MKCAIKSDTDHIAFLKEIEAWLNTLKYKNGETLPCLEGWKLNINCLLILWGELQSDQYIKADFLLTRRLNQDCLEHFLGIIRGKGGHRDNPDPKEFRLDYRQSVVDRLILLGRNTNCEEEDCYLLLKLSNLFMVIIDI